MEAKREELGHRQPGRAQNLSLAKLAAACFDGPGRIVRETERARSVGRGRGRPVAKSENSRNRVSARLLHDTPSRLFGLLEMQGQGSTGPGGAGLGAPVAAADHCDAEILSLLRAVPRRPAQPASA